MKSWKKPTNEMIDKTLKLIKKGTGSRYFFFRLKNPLWIQPLVERGYFQSPPSKIKYFDDYSDDVYVQYPSWPELQYLKNMSRDVPDEVINVVLDLPPVDNPSVYSEILEMALQLHGEQSVKLKPKILESTDINDRLLARKYADLLAHWVAENQTVAALELTKVLVEFVPDPQSETKQKRRRKDPTPATLWETSLEPSPRIGYSEYRAIMSKGVRPLAEEEPYQVACFLIDATADMIRLRTHQEDSDTGEDLSEAWCKRLRESDRYYKDSKTTLVHTLTFACERVYEKSPDSIVVLDEILRDQQWNIFRRLRQHLYAQYPNEQTKPWIRELILKHKEYHLWEHRYEFQRLIQNACEHFGETLLTEAERAQIFDAIRSGPSKANYQWWIVEGLGEEFTEERFQQRQQNFHRKQFKPFEPLLFGKYATDFQELEDKATVPISDEDYPPTKTRSGYVSTRSPRSPEDLTAFTDEKLLSYLNEWEGNEFLSKNNLFVEINIEGLAGAFQTVFKETIIPDANRLWFWLENRERIERPIYVRMMIHAMQAEVEEKNFDKLNEWLAFSEWVLSHPDQEHERNDRLGRQGDESRENPDWHNSRRAVGNFIEACLQEDINAPISARGQLAKLLEMLCTQFDSRLDNGKRTFSDQSNLLNDGFNNTRSRVLRTLVGFAFWLRQHDSESEVTELMMIVEKRFALQTKYPVTLPEYAIFGMLYPGIFNLNKEWAIEHKSDFFPQDKLPKWLAAFSTFICSNDPHKLTFETFLNDFNFALQHIAECKEQDHTEEEWIDTLGQHLFQYYLWGLYPLRESVENNDRYSLLERYYRATEDYPEHWANLFYYVGDFLWQTEQINKVIKDKILVFFDWRFEVKEPTELQQFTFWLQAKCLDAKWRLEAYSKILEVCELDAGEIAMQMETLCELLPNHTVKVLECFARLTDRSGDNNIYIQTEKAKTILKVGLESSDENVRQNAEYARENLLREGRFDLLDLDD